MRCPRTLHMTDRHGRPTSDVLEEWRSLERRLTRVSADDPDRARIAERIEQVRREYRSRVDEAALQDEPGATWSSIGAASAGQAAAGEDPSG